MKIALRYPKNNEIMILLLVILIEISYVGKKCPYRRSHFQVATHYL